MNSQNLELKKCKSIAVNPVLADLILSGHPELSGQECQWDRKVSFCIIPYSKPLLDIIISSMRHSVSSPDETPIREFKI